MKDAAQIVEAFAWLLSVPQVDLQAFLAAHWTDPNAPETSEQRLRSYGTARANAARRELSEKAPDRIRREVDELLAAGVCSTKEAAFGELAHLRHLTVAHIRSSYYRARGGVHKSQVRDCIHAPSRLGRNGAASNP